MRVINPVSLALISDATCKAEALTCKRSVRASRTSIGDTNHRHLGQSNWSEGE